MSFHLTECAKDVQLQPSMKLALMCFADSGSAEGRVARPGLNELMVWTGLQRSQALKVIKDLQELQLLAKHRSAFRGHRAEYVVFPNGCCDKHGKTPANVIEADFERVEKGSDAADPLESTALSTASGGSDPIDANGSDPRPLMGPISTPEWVRRSRSNVEPSNYVTPTTNSRVVTETGPLTSRGPSSPPITIDFRGVEKPPWERCPDCGDTGEIADAAGLPLTECPYCFNRPSSIQGVIA